MELSQLNQVVINTVELQYMIIPTVLIPLTMVSVAISVVATFIAGLFGIKLKAEGPKQLLEVLLKPRILIGAVLLNGLILGSISATKYIKNLPSFLSTIKSKNKELQKSSTMSYQDHLGRNNTHLSKTSLNKKSSQILKIKTIWHTKLKSGVFRAAIIGKESLFLGALDGYSYELSLKDGKILRQFFIGTMVTPAPLIFKEHLYLGEGVHKTHHARIYKFNLKSGQYDSSYSTKGHTEGQALLATHQNESLLFAVAGSDGVHAIDPITMKLKWKQNDGHIDSTVAYSQGLIFAGSGRDKENDQKFKPFATAYDFSTGKKIWKRELPVSSWMKPLVMDKQVCFVMGEIYFKSEYGGINCFSKDKGIPTYSFRSLTPIASIPFRINNSLYFADIHGKICLINFDQNNTLKCFDSKTKGLSYSSVAYDEKRNLIIYASKTKGLYLLTPKNLDFIFKWKPKDKDNKEYWHKTYASISISKKGDYLLSDMKGNIHLLRPLSR